MFKYCIMWLSMQQEFCIDSADRYVPPEFVTEQGFFFSSPVKHSLDGAFAARLLRLWLHGCKKWMPLNAQFLSCYIIVLFYELCSPFGHFQNIISCDLLWEEEYGN